MRLKTSLLACVLLFSLCFAFVPVCTATELPQQVVISQTQYQTLVQNSITLRTELTTLQTQIERLKTPSKELAQQLTELDNKLAKSEEQLRVAQQNLTICQSELESAKNSMTQISLSLETLKQQYNEEVEQNKKIQNRLRMQRTIYIITTVLFAGICACK